MLPKQLKHVGTQRGALATVASNSWERCKAVDPVHRKNITNQLYNHDEKSESS